MPQAEWNELRLFVSWCFWPCVDATLTSPWKKILFLLYHFWLKKEHECCSCQKEAWDKCSDCQVQFRCNTRLLAHKQRKVKVYRNRCIYLHMNIKTDDHDANTAGEFVSICPARPHLSVSLCINAITMNVHESKLSLELYPGQWPSLINGDPVPSFAGIFPLNWVSVFHFFPC